MVCGGSVDDRFTNVVKPPHKVPAGLRYETHRRAETRMVVVQPAGDVLVGGLTIRDIRMATGQGVNPRSYASKEKKDNSPCVYVLADLITGSVEIITPTEVCRRA